MREFRNSNIAIKNKCPSSQNFLVWKNKSQFKLNLETECLIWIPPKF